MSKRKRLQVFIEDELKPIMRAQSKRIKGCTHPDIGSESWYARLAILEKIKRDFPQIVNIESVKDLFK
jgi:hypothetical protein